MHAVRFFDGAAVLEGTLTVRDGVVQLIDDRAPAGTPRLDGLVTGLFTDQHVHLQLIDHTLLAGSRLGQVMDLGANLDWITELADEADEAARHDSADLQPSGAEPGRTGDGTPDSPESWSPIIQYAGPFLTAVGGYPADREWAPAGSVREIADAASAEAVVAELADADVSAIKIVVNTEAGPVLDDDTFREIVRQAAAHRIPVIAHAEGRGQAQRAVRPGADRLAHSPFSERLTVEEIAEQAVSASWISTMAIHQGEEYATVVDNVRRFVAAGGEIVYGSDMGNGDTPVDLRESEIAALREAGVDGLDLLVALAPADPLVAGSPLLLLPDDDPARSRHLTPEDLTSPAPSHRPAHLDDTEH